MRPVIIGAEKLVDSRTSPIWFKTALHRDGTTLRATTYMVADGEPQVLRTEVDLIPIMRAVKAAQDHKLKAIATASDDPQVGLKIKLFAKSNKKRKGLAGVVQRIGKKKLVRKTFNTIKDVARVTSKVAHSKGFRAGLAVTSAALAATGIGAPAAAALAGANIALTASAAYAKAAKDIHDDVKKTEVYKGVKGKLDKMGKAKASAALKKSPRLSAFLKAGAIAEAHVRKANTPEGRAALLKLKANSEKAKNYFASIAQTAKYSKDPVARDHANKLARVIKIAATSRANVKAISSQNSGGLPGLFIDSRGRFSKGRYKRATESTKATHGLLYSPTSTTRGKFLLAPAGSHVAPSPRGIAPRMSVPKMNVQKKAHELAAYNIRKDAASRAAKSVVETKKAIARENVRDSLKAKTALSKASKSGMPMTEQLRLAQGLAAKARANKAARAQTLKTKAVAALPFMRAAQKARKQVAPTAKARMALATLNLKARARKDVTAAVKVKRAAKKANVMDKMRVIAAMRKAKKSKMKKADQKRLAGALKIKLKAKARARSRAVAKTSSKARRSVATLKRLPFMANFSRTAGESQIGACLRIAGIDPLTAQTLRAAALRDKMRFGDVA